jgi:phospholipid/cholesterol/gamma-HCH transport system permease protein
MDRAASIGRTFLPARSFFEQVGEMMSLTARTITSAVRPPYPYGEEFIGQFLFALQLCWFPLLVSTVAFGFGAPGLQAANFLSLFGALDRLGGFFVLARSSTRCRCWASTRSRTWSCRASWR